MPLKILNPLDFPMSPGKENWFYIHPNDSVCEFFVPAGAAAVCIEPLSSFQVNKAYKITNYEKDNAWVSVQVEPSQEDPQIIKMPLYVFARHFDAEAFVRRRDFYQYWEDK